MRPLGTSLWRPGELVAAVGAAGAGDEAGIAEAHDELLEIGPGEVLVGGHLGEARRTGAEPPTELDHQPDAVLALRAERDRARAVERQARVRGGCGRDLARQGKVLNPE